MKYSTNVLLLFICILVADIVIRINSFIGISNGSTELTAVLHCICIVILLKIVCNYSLIGEIPYVGLLFFKMFMVWNTLTFIRGVLNAQDYWDWKMLLSGYFFSILVPLVIVIGVYYNSMNKLFSFVFNKLFVLCFLFIPLSLTTDFELYPRIVIIVSLLILTIPYIKIKFRILVIIVSIVSVAMDISYRVNVLRIIFPISLLIIYYTRHFMRIAIFNFVAFILFFLPILFLYLGINGNFNIYKENILDIEVVTGNTKSHELTNLSADTRTGLFEDTFATMHKRGSSFMFGEGAGSGYEAQGFSNVYVNDRGRYGSEVGFLNTIISAGWVGVLFYFSILIVSSFYAINRSNNHLCKMIGLFLAYHWVLFFIEDITALDLNFFCIWLSVGLSLSYKFRMLTDHEMKIFFSKCCEGHLNFIGNIHFPRIVW